MEQLPSYHLSGIVRDKNELVDFEGPLNLILLLLEKDKVEIRDLKVTEILDQYLAYLKQMEQMNLEVASEFIQMASYLLLIKTKELLSSDQEVSELEILMESLEQLRAKSTLTALKQVMPKLSDAYRQGVGIHSRPRMVLSEADKTYAYHHDGAELLAALRRAVLSGGEKPVDESDLRRINEAIPRKIQYSVKTKTKEILRRLSKGSLILSDLYSSAQSASEAVATFVAVLELCSRGPVFAQRNQENGTWTLQLRPESQNEEQWNELMEEIEKSYE